jgi:hypothetical protein
MRAAGLTVWPFHGPADLVTGDCRNAHTFLIGLLREGAMLSFDGEASLSRGLDEPLPEGKTGWDE